MEVKNKEELLELSVQATLEVLANCGYLLKEFKEDDEGIVRPYFSIKDEFKHISDKKRKNFFKKHGLQELVENKLLSQGLDISRVSYELS